MALMLAGTAALAQGVATAQGMAGPTSRPIRVMEDGHKVDVLTRLYGRFQRMARGSDEEISIRPFDFAHYPAEAFDELYWLDLVDMPGGDLVRVTRTTYNIKELAEQRVVYFPRWQLDAEPYLLTDEGATLAAMKVDAYLDRLSSEDPDLRHVTSLTAYQVKVTLQGRFRTYRAVAFWFGERGPAKLRLQVVDHVTQRVMEAAAEEVPGVDSIQRYLDETREVVHALAGRSVPQCCQERYRGNHVLGVQTSTAAHLTGSFQARPTFGFFCSCSSLCSSSCSPTVLGNCTDSGFTTNSCHAVNDNSAVTPGFGGMSGTSCEAAYACAAQACLFCACNIKVEVVPNENGGFKITIGAGPQHAAVWQRVPWTCPGCWIDPDCFHLP